MLPSSPRRASSSRRTTSGAMGGSHVGASAAENAMGGNVRIGRSSLAERVAIQNLLVPDSSQSTIIQSRELIDVTPGPVTNLSLDNLEDLQTENTLNQPIVVSTAFHAALNSVNTVIKSSDHVFFHVHYEVLDEASDNAFGSTLERNVAHAGVINVDDDSVTLNLILHMLYDWPSGRFSPTLRQLLYAVDRMPHYGLSVQWLIQPTKEIFALLYSMAPRHPLDIYTLAAHHSLHALAVLASSHLLAYAVHTLTNESVVRMGSVYFKNLAQLQMNRISSLRNILGVVPDFAHASCPADPQRAWALAAYDVVKDVKPDLSPNLLSASLMMYARGVQCPRCKKIFEVAISDAVSKWAMVKATI